MPRESFAVLPQVSAAAVHYGLHDVTEDMCCPYAKARLDHIYGIYGVDSGWTGKDKSQKPHSIHPESIPVTVTHADMGYMKLCSAVLSQEKRTTKVSHSSHSSACLEECWWVRARIGASTTLELSLLPLLRRSGGTSRSRALEGPVSAPFREPRSGTARQKLAE